MSSVCEHCEGEADLYEFCETIACLDCWQEYWRDNDIGLDESWEMWKSTSLTKID